jgi:hypothetical protein
VLMLSIQQHLQPRQRQPHHQPSQDIVLGMYYLTVDPKDMSHGQEGHPPLQGLRRGDARLRHGADRLHDWIEVRLERFFEEVVKEKDQPKKLRDSRRVVDDPRPPDLQRDPAAGHALLQLQRWARRARPA